jgi:SAM-dependent methyltransferase
MPGGRRHEEEREGALMALPKPKHLEPEYGAQFFDPSVASAYRFRPPYPEEVYTILAGLIVDGPRVVLELGCGVGEIARRLAAQTDRVDAVEPSHAMLALARTLPGGERSNLQWYCCTAEEFAYVPGYGLVIAAESLHWMDWYRVLPAIRAVLAARGSLVVLDRRLDTVPWWRALRPLIPQYSTNRDFQPYDLLDELARRQLFHPEGRATTTPVLFSQSVEDYIESWHSRNGFSRERMSTSRALEFDARVREIVRPYVRAGLLHYEVQVELAWGVPSDRRGR